MVVPNQKMALIIYQGLLEGSEKINLTADSGVRSENNFPEDSYKQGILLFNFGDLLEKRNVLCV